MGRSLYKLASGLFLAVSTVPWTGRKTGPSPGGCRKSTAKQPGHKKGMTTSITVLAYMDSQCGASDYRFPPNKSRISVTIINTGPVITSTGEVTINIINI